MNDFVTDSKATLTKDQVIIAARKLARIYNMLTKGKRVDSYEKDKYYAMAAKHREIHYLALAINRRRKRR